MPTIKPSYGTPYNQYSSFASGLAAFYAINENTGSVLHDLSGNGFNLTGNNVGNPGWTTGPNGEIAYHSNGNIDSGGFENASNNQNPFASTSISAKSMMWYGVLNSNKIGDLFYDNSQNFFIVYNPSGTVRSDGTVANSLTGNFGLTGFGGTTDSIVPPPASGQPLMVICTAQNDTINNNVIHAMWINGVRVSSGISNGRQLINSTGQFGFFGIENIFSSSENPDATICEAALWTRVLSDSEISSLSNDPYAIFAPPPTPTTIYHVSAIKSVCFSGDTLNISITPDQNTSFPSGTTVTITPSIGSPVTTNLNALGGIINFIPNIAGSLILTFSNNKGLINPSPANVLVRQGVSGPSGINPTPINNGFYFPSSSNPLIVPYSARTRNIFIVGEPITFWWSHAFDAGFEIDKPSTGYYVYDFYGNLVDSATWPRTQSGDLKMITINNCQKPGWYRIHIVNAGFNDPGLGDYVGATNFIVIPSDANLPNPDGISWSDQFSDFPPEALNSPTISTVVGSFSSFSSSSSRSAYIKFTGSFIPSSTGSYVFSIAGFHEPAKITINGQIAAMQWPVQTQFNNPSFNLTIGQTVPIIIEYILTPNQTYTPNLTYSINGGANTALQPSSCKDDNGISGQLTQRTVVGYQSVDSVAGADDPYLHAICGIGPIRIAVDYNTTASSLAEEIRVISTFSINRDSVRPQKVLFAFANYPNNFTAGVVTTLLQNIIALGLISANQIAVECQNEPQGNDPTSYATTFATWAQEVRAADPSITILAASTVSIDPTNLTWLGTFFDTMNTNGNMNLIDGLSFHGYNVGNGDPYWMRTEVNAYKALLSSKGLNGKPIWQTEQGDFYASYGDYWIRHGVQRTMVRLHLFEQLGIPKEQNVLWYDRDHGFNDFPAWLINNDGGPNPIVPILRTWGSKLFGKTFKSSFSFDGTRDKFFIGSLFSGTTGTVAVFQNSGDHNATLLINVIGASSLKYTDSFGNTSTITITSGYAFINVPDSPIYLDIPNGVTISIPNSGWGTNLALSATPASSANDNASSINNGNFETPASRYSPLSPDYFVGGSNDTELSTGDAWVSLTWPTSQTINRVNLYCLPPFSTESVPLDYELQYWNGSTWSTIQHIFEQPIVMQSFGNDVNCTVEDYSSRKSIFQHTFSAVNTTAIRLLCHLASYGGNTLKADNNAGGQGWSPLFSVREVEVYNASNISIPTSNLYLTSILTNIPFNNTDNKVISKYNTIYTSQTGRSYLSLPNNAQSGIISGNLNNTNISLIKGGYLTGEGDQTPNFFKIDSVASPSGFTITGQSLGDQSTNTSYSPDKVVEKPYSINYIRSGTQIIKQF